MKRKLPAIGTSALLLIFWQAAAMLIDIPHILPAPTAILQRIWELREVLFGVHLPETLVTIFLGLALSVGIGFLLAAAMDASAILEAMLYPVLTVTQTIPIMCIAPLFVLWFGYSILSLIHI